MGLFEIISDSGRSPTPLLTSVIGTAATLVAIIGGFLVARLSGLAQVREAAQERTKEAKLLRDRAETELETLRSADIDLARRSWLAKALPLIVGRPNLTVTYLETPCGVWPHDHAHLTPDLDRIRTYSRQAGEVIAQAANGAPLPAGWRNFKEEHGLRVQPGPEEATYEQVYVSRWILQEQDRLNREIAESNLLTSATDNQDRTRRLTTQRARLRARETVKEFALKPPTESEIRENGVKLGNAQTRFVDLGSDVERAEAAERVSAIPPNTRSSLNVLAYLGVVDVLVPLGFLAAEPTEIGLGLRIGLVATLALGILALVYVLAGTFSVEDRRRSWRRRDRKIPPTKVEPKGSSATHG